MNIIKKTNTVYTIKSLWAERKIRGWGERERESIREHNNIIIDKTHRSYALGGLNFCYTI